MPPLAGFLAKFFIISAAVEMNLLSVAVIMVINSVIALYYYMRIIKVMFLNESSQPSGYVKSLGLRLALLIILYANIIFGLWPHPLLQWLTQIVHMT